MASILSLRVQAKDDSTPIYSLIAVLIDASSNKILGSDSIVTGEAASVQFPVRSTYQDYLNVIQRFKYSGQILKNHSAKLQEILKIRLSSESLQEELFYYVEENQPANVRELFAKILRESIGNTALKTEIVYETISQSDISKTSNVQAAPQASAPDSSLKEEIPGLNPEEAVAAERPMVKFKFMLSPVSGIPVNELRKGNPIIAKLDKNDPLSTELITQLALLDKEGNVQPTKALIQSIEHSGNSSTVIVQFSNGTLGKNIEEENSVKVRVTMPEPSKQAVAVERKEMKEKLNKDSSFLYIIIGIGFLLGLLGIVIIFLT